MPAFPSPAQPQGRGGGGPLCPHCRRPGHAPQDCPAMLAQAEQAELSMRQTHPVATQWGIILDPKLRLTRPDPGFPAADSAEFSMLIGWTLIGLNGRPVRGFKEADDRLQRPAQPGETLTLMCRSPMPGQDDPNARPCGDWKKGLCLRGEICKYLHAPAERGIDAMGTLGGAARGVARPPPRAKAASATPIAAAASGLPAAQPARVATAAPVAAAAAPARQQQQQPQPSGLPAAYDDVAARLRSQVGAAAERVQQGGPMGGARPPTMNEQRRAGMRDPSAYPGGPLPGGPIGGPMQMMGRGRNMAMPPSSAPAPCHPIGMSKAEADAERILEQAAKRARADDGQVGQQMAVLANQVRTELLGVRMELQKELKDRDALLAKLQEYEKVIQQQQVKARQTEQALKADQANDELQRKLDKYKKKLEKLREEASARDADNVTQRRRALSKSVELISDEDVSYLANIQSTLDLPDAWAILGMSRGDKGFANAAKKLMAKLHPDRVPVDACKDGLRKRFQLVQHAKDLITPTMPDD
eukprot:TRINITY_DN65783_c0_g1_i1.p1 TRINITY_DN65783_c0_g1~~TRINITY_DN65783_c0_g1_i1.p1  ORF type:complete len:565 (+),score=196.29 TRINITY_DN65783_c0_g1_i1:108-1697(+)